MSGPIGRLRKVPWSGYNRRGPERELNVFNENVQLRAGRTPPKLLKCRVSTVVVQRFCKPKAGGSNPSPGTKEINGLGETQDIPYLALVSSPPVLVGAGELGRLGPL